MILTFALFLVLSALLTAGAGLVALRDVAAEHRQTCARLLEVTQQRDAAQFELARHREKRHTHQTIAMLEDLSAVHMDILSELKIFYHRMGALLSRLAPGTGPSAEAAAYHREFCTYTRARLRAIESIMHAGRRGPFSYIPPAASRPARPGATRR
jgi:hypothetical protein